MSITPWAKQAEEMMKKFDYIWPKVEKFMQSKYKIGQSVFVDGKYREITAVRKTCHEYVNEDRKEYAFEYQVYWMPTWIKEKHLSLTASDDLVRNIQIERDKAAEYLMTKLEAKAVQSIMNIIDLMIKKAQLNEQATTKER